MLRPRLEVIIRPNRISVRNMDSGGTGSAEGPFSCEHLLVDDLDILEHVILRAFHDLVGRRFWSVPRVFASTDDRPIHRIEHKFIRDALLNAGASHVSFNESVRVMDEQQTARSAYLERWKRKR